MNTETQSNGQASTAQTNGKQTAIMGEYEGKPMIILNPSQRYPFQFQIAKARLIVDNIDAIRAFVDSQK